ncbi:erg26, C-3 sterol dehydrogenase [Saitozyma podzolica]|uniref:Erg26, C-3 sterol dehydrogenase n=1 Tax=Saitozyma podzolica TaxID=1890683 RepID=A0A427YLV7_9TREE|nr:erg26, C-3 sterol dehydrogenase [Saitozyma podzolica]
MPGSESYLVVGGCGFLGRHIVEQLLARGETQVSVFDIVQRHFDSNVTFYIGDIAKPEDVTNALKKSNATAVIHTASPAHGGKPEIYELVNVTGTRNIIDCCLDLGVKKLVYTSSAGVIYDGAMDIVSVDERLPYPTKPLDAYNRTKAEAEKMVLDANSEELATCALRPAGIFGPGDRQMINGFYQVIQNNQTRFQIGDNLNVYDFTYVGNVAYAHLLAVDKLDQRYPYMSFREPIASIDMSLGAHRVPTSDAHPLGPNASPSEADRLAAQRFASGQFEEADQRPVLRNRMDQFGPQANLEDDEEGYPIAGQAFFITNGEPIYFWDFARAIWSQFGHTPPYIIAIPVAIGLILATLAEAFSKLTGKEPGFTRFRVAIATQQKYHDIEKARRLLGYEPQVGLADGLKKWTEWYKGELEKQRGTETEKTK